MVRQAHGAPKKKAAKKTVAKSLRDRATAKKRSKKIAAKVTPDRTAKRSTRATEHPEIIRSVPGESPQTTIRRETRGGTAVNLRSDIDENRSSEFDGLITDEAINHICRHLEFGMYRITTERVMGLGRGRIAKWIRRGLASRAEADKWADSVDDLLEDGMELDDAIARAGPRPEPNIYARFHAKVLIAEGTGERAAMADIINAAAAGDWKARAWMLTRRYGQRWGDKAARGDMPEEEDEITSNVKAKSACEEMAEVLEKMFGRRAKDTDDEGIPK